jgi:hypothetical protein
MRRTHHVFDHNESAKAKYWPNLEDVFTNIDLAANPGFRRQGLKSARSMDKARLGHEVKIPFQDGS